MRRNPLNLGLVMSKLSSDPLFSALWAPEEIRQQPFQTLEEMGNLPPEAKDRGPEHLALIIEHEYGDLLEKMKIDGKLRCIVEMERLTRLGNQTFDVVLQEGEEPVTLTHERTRDSYSHFDPKMLFEKEGVFEIKYSQKELGQIESLTNIHVVSKQFTNLFSRFSASIDLPSGWGEKHKRFKELYYEELEPFMKRRNEMIHNLLEEKYDISVIAKKLEGDDQNMVKKYADLITDFRTMVSQTRQRFYNGVLRVLDTYSQMIGSADFFLFEYDFPRILMLDDENHVLTADNMNIQTPMTYGHLTNIGTTLYTEGLPFNKAFHSTLAKELLVAKREPEKSEKKALYYLKSAHACMSDGNYTAAIKEAATAFASFLEDYLFEQDIIEKNKGRVPTLGALIKLTDEHMFSKTGSHPWDFELYKKLIAAPNAVQKIRNRIVHSGVLDQKVSLPDRSVAWFTIATYTEAIEQLRYDDWQNPRTCRTSDVFALYIDPTYEQLIPAVNSELAKETLRKGLHQLLRWLEPEEISYQAQLIPKYSWAKPILDEWVARQPNPKE